MDLWQQLGTVLRPGAEYLWTPLLATLAPLLLSVSIGYYLIGRSKRQAAKMQSLTAEVDDLRRRLDFIRATTLAVSAQLEGIGPFELPLVTQINLLKSKNDRLVAGFRSATGKRIFAEVSYRAVAQLLNDDRSMPLDKAVLATSAVLDLAGPADAYELPLLPRFEGHVQRGPDRRILVFSCEQGRKILFPVSLETYRALLVQLKAALAARR
jgi:hypothetical protein